MDFELDLANIIKGISLNEINVKNTKKINLLYNRLKKQG